MYDMYIYIYTYITVCIDICMHKYHTYMYLNICMYTYIHLYTRVHTCKHTVIHTHSTRMGQGSQGEKIPAFSNVSFSCMLGSFSSRSLRTRYSEPCTTRTRGVSPGCARARQSARAARPGCAHARQSARAPRQSARAPRARSQNQRVVPRLACTGEAHAHGRTRVHCGRRDMADTCVMPGSSTRSNSGCEKPVSVMRFLPKPAQPP